MISFEGNLIGWEFRAFPGLSETETGALSRNSSWPEQNVVIVPLEKTTIKQSTLAIGGTVLKTILHVQIEKAWRIQEAVS